MPSKTSKQPNSNSPWKVASNCVESQISQIALELASELQIGDRILLEGPMGVGKTTFARALLQGLGVIQAAEGSPTFPIAHEYDSVRGEIVHIDFYRLSQLEEIEAAGILSYFWERPLIVICEWLSSFPELQKEVLRSGRIFQLNLSFSNHEKRNIEIHQLNFLAN